MADESGYESGSEHSLPSSESQGTRNESGSDQSLPSSESQGTRNESGSEQSLPSSASQGTKNESGSEQSLPTSTSQGTSGSDSKENKVQRRCYVCKNYVDEDLMIPWCRRNETGTGLFCSSISDSAPDMWTCAKCNSSTRAIEDSGESDTSRSNQVKAGSSSRTNQDVDNEVVHDKKATSDDSGNESDNSRTNQAASSSRINPVEKEVVQQKTTSDSCNEIPATNPPSQTHKRPAVEEAFSPMKKQTKSDSDAHSDSGSAK